MKGKYVLIGVLVFAINVLFPSISFCKEIELDAAISVAETAANKYGYDIKCSQIEVVRFKKSLEKGPLRMVWLIRNYPKDISEKLINKEFWIIYFYPKDQHGGSVFLGGDFTVFVDLHTGEVIEVLAGQ